MLDIRTVLCPVDFSRITDRELQLASEICRFFGARLVLIHTLEGTPPASMGVGWMWAGEHRAKEEKRRERAREQLTKLLATLSPQVECDGVVCQGEVDQVLLEETRSRHADLVVMATHGIENEEHRSATATFVAHAPCPVLTLREAALDTDMFSADPTDKQPFPVLVPLDYERHSLAAAAYAFELAALLPIELHLLHVESARRRRTLAQSEEEKERDRERLAAMTPATLAARIHVHVTTGAPAEEIATQTDRLGASLVIMGVHEKGFLRRWVDGAPSRDTLFASPCPVLFVSAVTARRLRRQPVAS